MWKMNGEIWVHHIWWIVYSNAWIQFYNLLEKSYKIIKNTTMIFLNNMNCIMYSTYYYVSLCVIIWNLLLSSTAMRNILTHSYFLNNKLPKYYQRHQK